jgi:glutathione peroxidase
MAFMKSSTLIITILAFGAASVMAQESATKEKKTKPPAALAFKMKSLEGKEVSLSKYHGKVVMVVNVASKCGLTPQYKQLQALHEKYGKQGLAILGFPCNQFRGQEPGTDKEIQTFCQENYGVKFDMFSKVDVNGKEACELYKHLTSQKIKPAGTGKIKWNFEKFVIGRDGKPIARFEPRTKPDSKEMIKTIEAALKEKPTAAKS